MTDNTAWPTGGLDDHVQYLITQAVDAAVTSKLAAASGLATLGTDGKVPTAQLPAYFGVTEDALTGYLADLSQYQASTPTLEELIVAGMFDSINGQRGSSTVTTWSKTATPQPIADAFILGLFVAPFDMKVLGCDLTWEYWNLGASDQNYWTINIQALETSTTTVLATRETTASGTNSNGSIVARRPWSFDAASWVDHTIVKGGLVQMSATPSKAKTSSGNNYVQSCYPFGSPMQWTIRYSPV